jgi:hypothetical protein
MRSFRSAAVFFLAVLVFVSACGGEGEESEVEEAVHSYLLREDVHLNPGANPDGVTVTMKRGAREAFLDPNRTIEDSFVEDTRIEGDTATASVSFLVATIGETFGCESRVALDRRAGAWHPRTFTISSCQ